MSLETLNMRLPALLAALILVASGCSTPGSTVLKVDATELQGVQSLRQEITRMLDDLGYDWLPVQDPNVTSPVKAYRHANQWKMRFQARDRPEIRIDARFDIGGSTASLRFFEVGVENFSSVAKSYYRALRERLVLEFGPHQVKGQGSL